MNKQELIERIDKLPYVEGPIADVVTVNREWILKSIEQLDELQKVTVPQFVADWYEGNKDDFETVLFNVIYVIFRKRNENKLSDFEEWLMDEHTKPFQTLVNMHQFGYEVEKEKRYYVRFKWIEDAYSYLTLIKHLNTWTLTNIKIDKKFRTEHTKKQLEDAGFGWVFNCEGIEIEEVTE